MQSFFFPRFLFVLGLFLLHDLSCECLADDVLSAETPAPSVRPTVCLGFPIIGRDRQPPEINLAKDQSLGSAFLLQLRRQALLLSARDEFGAVTRDAFLDENTSDGAVNVPDIAAFPGADPTYRDHRSYLVELETLSRTKFVAELEKLGLGKSLPPKEERGEKFEKERSKIEKLLQTWALIPHFEALRRIHGAIRIYGESPELLALLVRGYTQMQIQTNNAPRDSHRVFQARSMLYAQRLVAKYGETPEHLSLRAAAWSLNDFHRLARLEFEKIAGKGLEIPKTPWIEAAKYYADFDFKGLETLIETVESEAEKPTLLLIKYLMLDLSANPATLERPFGEQIIVDLPDCSRLYESIFAVNTFDMIYAPDRSPFYEYLARRIAPVLKKMPNLPEAVHEKAEKLRSTVKKPTSGLFGLFGNAPTVQGFPTEQYFLDLGELLNALKESSTDPVEPSLPMLGLLLRDDEFRIVQEVSNGIRGHNGSPESYIIPALPVIGEHPAFEFLGLAVRDHSTRTPFWHRLTTKVIPYNLFSIRCTGLSQFQRDTDFHGRIYSPYFIACLFVDRENIRDMSSYHRCAIREIRPGEHYFLVDDFYDLCPNNPYAVAIRLARGKNLTPEEAERLLKEFDSFPNVRAEATFYYDKTGNYDKVVELMKENFEAKPTSQLAQDLARAYLTRGKREQAIEVFKRFLQTPESEQQLTGQSASRNIGFILLQEGKIREAEEWLIPAARTHASWGLVGMSEYQEIIGNFDAAEKLMQAEMRSYSSGPFGWWACCYRTNHANLKESMDAILDRYERYKSANPIDSTTLMNNQIRNYQVIYPCYCMDMPLPEQMGADPINQEFLRAGIGMFGFLAWLEAMEKKDLKKAKVILNRLRELWFLDDKKDPFVAAQRTVLPKIQERQYVDYGYQMFAALIEADQQSERPGNPDAAEIDYLLRANYQHDLDPGMMPWLLYLLGRYYDFYEKKNEAAQCYRRVLGLRVDFNYYLRCLAVKELRKSGMTDEDYVRYSQSDPKIPLFDVSYSDLDRFCRQHFRDYSASPSESVLARPVAAKPVAATSLGKTTPIAAGWYKVTSVLFRGKSIPENENVVYWRIPDGSDTDDTNWSMSGIARIGPFETQRKEARPDGCYPLQLGTLPALASFHGDRMALVVSLKPDEEPTTMLPKTDSPCVRVEMKKVADIPVPEPMIPVAAMGGEDRKTDQLDDDAEKWMRDARLIILGVSVLAILVAVLLSLLGKKKSKTNDEP